MIPTLPFAPNDETCREIREAISEWDDTTRVIVGHGSGSFGHVAAAKHSTIDGVSGAVQWRGFCDVSDAASRLNRWLLLAGETEGVFGGDGACVPEISLESLPSIEGSLGGSRGTDVTGGMASKVRDMISLVESLPGARIRIFSGLTPGGVKRTLLLAAGREGQEPTQGGSGGSSGGSGGPTTGGLGTVIVASATTAAAVAPAVSTAVVCEVGGGGGIS
ncbi:aspartate/glutamate/uridylate kinase [Ectocarpus siliculosus]|uniref:Aspartate/glutamate/uridylate kinase n=1 Tax=Ectocarpus siliculosus TaxID=2880 RepID=D8LBJ6_ECTSI|nr:aspartate/glutamate/uridylate kinase [Ectocarpus siliculosus]|eukprot:CBN76705.1 aspartate/glutamate/uridylate kinase [Ectocarpus siliculosus]